MIDMIVQHFMSNILAYAVGAGSLSTFTYVLKKIPTETVRDALYKVFFIAGKKVNDFFKSWKFTKATWNNLLEPWLVGFIRMIFVTIPEAFCAGLAYDDKKEE